MSNLATDLSMGRNWIAIGLTFMGATTAATCQQTSFAQEVEPTLPPGIEAQFIGRGWQLTTQDGMTLYTLEDEAISGEPVCYDECAESWRPVSAEAGSVVEGGWTLVERKDGSRQLAFKNQPIYTHVHDPFPGATFGATPRNNWDIAVHSISMPPSLSIKETPLGYILVGDGGRAIYISTGEKITPDSSAERQCNLDCLIKWEPVYAPQLARAIGNFSVIDWSDGTRQWAFKSHPLYLYVGDSSSGTVLGGGIDGMQVAILTPPPLIPDWVIEQSTDAGKLLALKKGGRVLYIHQEPVAREGGIPCDQACFDTFWSPVAADQFSGDIGDWTVIQSNGKDQWAYKGRPLFVSKLDEWPGDVSGGKVYFYRAFKTITRTGKPIAKLF